LCVLKILYLNCIHDSCLSTPSYEDNFAPTPTHHFFLHLQALLAHMGHQCSCIYAHTYQSFMYF
jgi:hypothetical protein